MLNNTANLNWALELFTKLEGMLGYPRTEPPLIFTCEEFLSIVHDREKGEWLFRELARGCTRFPIPRVMREIYNNRYTPADGLKPEDLFVVKYGVQE